MQQWVLSRCYLRCILYTDPAVHAAYNSKVEAVRLSAASASTMRLALWHASMSSCHGTARLLTPSPPTMCYAFACVVTAALSAAVRLAVALSASSCLGTVRFKSVSRSGPLLDTVVPHHAPCNVACHLTPSTWSTLLRTLPLTPTHCSTQQHAWGRF